MRESPVPVICDRCRAEGRVGADPFEAFGALLDFDPVPRRTARADGWDAEVQRTFVAALSLTGSYRQAARAVGKAAFGADQLLRHEGSEGFRAACEEAMALAADERSRRLAEGLRTVAAEQAGWRPADPPWAKARSRAAQPLPEEEAAEESAESGREHFLETVLVKYLLKVDQERRSRLEGRIVEADLYVRQLTWLEVALDLASGDGLRFLRDFRHSGRALGDIAETPMSQLLGAARRRIWARFGEPPRPLHPPPGRLVEEDGFSTEPLEPCREFGRAGDEARQRDADAQAAAAAAQAEWEARLPRL